MTHTDRDLYPDPDYYQALWSKREREAPPSLGAIMAADHAEALAALRGEPSPLPDPTEPRWVRDCYDGRAFDGGGHYTLPWHLDSGPEFDR